jgi:hypothetical protein
VASAANDIAFCKMSRFQDALASNAGDQILMQRLVASPRATKR